MVREKYSSKNASRSTVAATWRLPVGVRYELRRGIASLSPHLIPSNPATLSGTALLDASASDNVKVTGLEYHLTGGAFQDTRVGVATPARYGWIFNWNTSSIPNGGYTLKSVAFDAAGNIGRSANVSITVRN